MGTSRQSEAAEDKWSVFAGCAGWRCAVCGCVPPYTDRTVYLRTKMCKVCGSARAELLPGSAAQSAGPIA